MVKLGFDKQKNSTKENFCIEFNHLQGVIKNCLDPDPSMQAC